MKSKAIYGKIIILALVLFNIFILKGENTILACSTGNARMEVQKALNIRSDEGAVIGQVPRSPDGYAYFEIKNCMTTTSNITETLNAKSKENYRWYSISVNGNEGYVAEVGKIEFGYIPKSVQQVIGNEDALTQRVVNEIREEVKPKPLTLCTNKSTVSSYKAQNGVNIKSGKEESAIVIKALSAGAKFDICAEEKTKSNQTWLVLNEGYVLKSGRTEEVSSNTSINNARNVSTEKLDASYSSPTYPIASAFEPESFSYESDISVGLEEALGEDFRFIKKAKAQTQPPLPVNIDFDSVESGGYTIEIPKYKKAEFKIYKDGVKVQFFSDKNKNGKKDSGEEILNVKELDVKVNKVEDIRIYDITQGWNLVGLPIFSEKLTTAKSLALELAKQGVSVEQISKYDSGNWIHYLIRIDSNGNIKEYGENFSLVPSEAYFLRSLDSKSVVLSGSAFSESVEMNLEEGWNLVSIQSVEKYDYEKIISRCRNSGIGCEEIYAYKYGKYEGFVFTLGEYFGLNESIESQSGYFIKVNGPAGSWKP